MNPPKMHPATILNAKISSAGHHDEHVEEKSDKNQHRKVRVSLDIMKGMSHIAIITVVYRNYDVLRDFLRSLDTQTTSGFSLFISDASPDKKSISSELLPITIVPIKNKGYAHGVNQGILRAIEMGYDRFCIINSDTIVKDDFVEKVQSAFEKHPKELFGGKIYYASGFEYHKETYRKGDLGKVLWYAGGISDWNHATTKHRGVDEVDNGQYDLEEKTEFITGCLMCFDKEVWNTVGNWDENYFLYYEDADYGERAKRAGLSLWYDPNIVLWHKNAQSTGGSGSALHEKIQKKAHLRYAFKYAPWRTKLHVIKNYFTKIT